MEVRVCNKLALGEQSGMTCNVVLGVVYSPKYTVATNGSGRGQEVSSEAFPSNPRERKERVIAKIRTHGRLPFSTSWRKIIWNPKAPPSPIPTGNYSLSPEEVANKVELISWVSISGLMTEVHSIHQKKPLKYLTLCPKKDILNIMVNFKELRAKTAAARECDAAWKGEKHIQSTNLTPASPEGKTQSPTTMDENSQHSAVDYPSPQPEPQRVTENDDVQSDSFGVFVFIYEANGMDSDFVERCSLQPNGGDAVERCSRNAALDMEPVKQAPEYIRQAD
ncbi:hypothetical protein L2E82_27388 [Cichorium intybus]|uniref:Uncharacterized protein n=1 Tax=Cichorium intybus TaxID=13427 RepID=A0ACB9CSY7_CICIN|nr:hypothetical protein L2E82_27388 [Cichorium intybus]